MPQLTENYSSLDELIADMNIVDDSFGDPQLEEGCMDLHLESAELDDMDTIMQDMQEMAEQETSRSRKRDTRPAWK